MRRLMMDRGFFAKARGAARVAVAAGNIPERRETCQDEKDWRDYIGTVRVEDVGDRTIVRRLKIDSPIMFEPTGWDMYSSLPTDRIVAAVNEAAEDPFVDVIVLELDCPGGTVAGWDDIASAVKAAAALKPVKALVHEGAYSLGYRLACLCSEIVATPTAMVGSIGTIVMLYDDSAMYAEAGVIAKPIASDDNKAQGYGGVTLTDEFLAHVRAEIVEPDYAAFVAEVAAARKLSSEVVRRYGSLCYPAQRALELGLIDQIKNADAYVAELATGAPQQDPRPALGDGNGSEGADMTVAQLKEKFPDLVAQIEQGAVAGAAAELAAEAAKPATFAQLKAEFGADNGFIVEALDKGLTLSAARKQWTDKVNNEVSTMRAQLETANKRVAELETLPARGREEAVPTGGTGVAGNAGGDYETLVKAKRASGLNELQAHAAVQKERPDLHAKFCASAAQGCNFK